MSRRTIVAETIEVLVWIKERPKGTVEGMDLTLFAPGETYDLTPALADYLIIQGFALLEMRRRDRLSEPPVIERRRYRRY